MALLKKITDNKGIVANYHKISTITNDNGMVTVEVHSYANEDYRTRENNCKKLFARQLDIGARLAELCAIPAEERTKKDVDEIGKLAMEDAKISANVSDADCSISKALYELDFTDGEEISFTNIYKKLKALDAFKDAKDLM